MDESFKTLLTAMDIELPSDCEIISGSKTKLQVKRGDGLMVFLDSGQDNIIKYINKIRLTADKETVIKTVAIFRGLQIVANYTKKHAPELLEQIYNDYSRKYLEKAIILE